MALDLTSHVQLFRPAAGGATLKEAWPLDVWVKLGVLAGLFECTIQDTAPGDTTKLWLDTAVDPTTANGVLKVYDGSIWIVAAGNYPYVSGLLASAGPGRWSADGLQGLATALAGDATARSTLNGGVMSALDASDAQAIVAQIAADPTARTNIKDAVVGALDPADYSNLAAGIGATPGATDAIKDAAFAALEGSDAQAMVNAIQADATALADLLTSTTNAIVPTGNPASNTATNVEFLLPTSGGYEVEIQFARLSGNGGGSGNSEWVLQLWNGTSWVNAWSNSGGSGSGNRIIIPAGSVFITVITSDIVVKGINAATSTIPTINVSRQGLTTIDSVASPGSDEPGFQARTGVFNTSLLTLSTLKARILAVTGNLAWDRLVARRTI